MTIRTLLLVLVLAVFAHAEGEEVRTLLNAERFAEALQAADAALQEHPRDGRLARMRAKALAGIARDLQRERGHGAAVDFLEQHLDEHEVIAVWYGRTCAWAGEEERGLRALRASSLPLERRLDPELRLLALLRRYDEMRERAAAPGFEGAEEWRAWGAEEAGLGGRLASRARRAGYLLLGAVLLFGAVIAWLLRRLSRLPASSGSRS